jgi:tetratricopeptide (TPR) repeat protein
MVAKALTGAYTEALDIAGKIKDLPGGLEEQTFRKNYAWILALAARREEALEALKEHVAIQARKNIDTSFDEACVYAGLGDKGRAFELLNRAYENHSSPIMLLVSDYALHSLHGDPRFEELVRKIGFPAIPKIVQTKN